MAKRKIVKRKTWTNPAHTGLVDFLDYYDDDKLDKAKEWFLELFTTSKDWRSQYREKWLEYYQLYRNYSSYYENRPSWQSSYFVPVVFEAVETELPRVLDSLYSMPPLWIALPKKPKYNDLVKSLEMLLDTRAHQNNLFMTHYETFKSTLMYGTAIEKLSYETRPDYEGTVIEPRDLFDFYPDPLRKSIKTMRYCYDRAVQQDQELLLLEEQKVYRDIKDKVLKKERSSNDYGKYFSHLDRLRVIGNTDPSGDSVMGKMHEVLEYWGKWVDKETNEWFDVVAVIIDREFLVRFEETPYRFATGDGEYIYAMKPFIEYRNVVLQNEFYGMGITEVILPMAYEINDMRNMVNDAIQYAVVPAFEVTKGAVKDLDSVALSPGEMIQTLTPSQAVRPVAKDTGFIHGLNNIEKIKHEIQDALGIFDPVRGQVSQRRMTATEAIQLVTEAYVRLNMITKIAGKTSLPQEAEMIYRMERQFTDEEIFARIIEGDKVSAFLKIKPSTLEYEGDFRIRVGALYGHKTAMAQTALHIFEVASKMPDDVRQKVNFEGLLRYIALAMDMPESSVFIEETPEKPDLRLLRGGVAGVPGVEGMQPTLAPSPEEMARVGAAAAPAPVEGAVSPQLAGFIAEMKRKAGIK